MKNKEEYYESWVGPLHYGNYVPIIMKETEYGLLNHRPAKLNPPEPPKSNDEDLWFLKSRPFTFPEPFFYRPCICKK